MTIRPGPGLALVPLPNLGDGVPYIRTATILRLVGSPVPPGQVVIVDGPIALALLSDVAARQFGDMVKAVVDVSRSRMAIGGEMHADEEAVLLSEGSGQADLWGVNLYPAEHGTERFIEYDSLINLRPAQGNRSRSVDDPGLRARIAELVGRLVAPS